MPTVGEPRPIDYPTNFSDLNNDMGNHTNLVASGLPVYYTSTGGGGNATVQYDAGSFGKYGLFYDVYLIKAPDSSRDPYCRYVYEFVYWSSRITPGIRDGVTKVWGPRVLQEFDGRAVPDGADSADGPLPSVQYLASWRPSPNVTRIPLGAALNNVSGNGQYANPAGPLLYRTNEVKIVRNSDRSVLPDLSGSVPTVPSSIGWKNTGKAPLYTPKRGPGGDPYYKTTGDVNTDYPKDPGGSDSTGNNGNGGGGGNNNDGTTGDTDTPPPVPAGFNLRRNVYWNPPIISTATGAYVGVSVGSTFDPSAPPTRDAIMGTGSRYIRQMRKGFLVQNIVNSEEWTVTGDGGSVTTGKGKKKSTDSWAKGDSIVEPGVRYGFRFHYNPSEVNFQTQSLTDIDPGIIVSGLEKAFPAVAGGGSSVNITIYLNRIEDMSFIEGIPGPKDNKKKSWRLWKDLYAGKNLKPEDLAGIATRGTGYDLEFLYRTAMGRAFPTALRGYTADLGVILGLPMILNLGGGMRYSGRLTGLSYTHQSFTEDMIPMFTTVSLSFTRVPDAARFNKEPKSKTSPGSGSNGLPMDSVADHWKVYDAYNRN